MEVLAVCYVDGLLTWSRLRLVLRRHRVAAYEMPSVALVSTDPVTLLDDKVSTRGGHDNRVLVLDLDGVTTNKGRHFADVSLVQLKAGDIIYPDLIVC